jgi:Na+(H+)/acetate symporter ActP
MKIQKAFSVALLMIEIMITLFVAGIVAPSLLRSEFATKEALAAGSLRTLNIAGIAFFYTRQNIESAVIGGLVGIMAAIAIYLYAPSPKNRTTTTTLRPASLRHSKESNLFGC